MEYLIIIAVGWFLVEFEPLQMLVDTVQQKFKKRNILHAIVNYLLGAFTCWQCMTFWSGLVISGDFFTACVASLGSLIIETWIAKN